MNNEEMLNNLWESSSLREDMLIYLKNIIVDLINNIELTDELLARVNSETYNFILGFKKSKLTYLKKNRKI